MIRRLFSGGLVATLLLGGGVSVRGIATADNTISADNPTNHGYSLNWDYIHNYKGSSAVAIDRYWILTASHVADDGGSGSLTINGETYTQQQIIVHPTADLALVRFDKPLPGYYPLYSGEVYTTSGHGLNAIKTYNELLVTGYGYTGAVTAVSFENGPGGRGTKRWGTNRETGEATENVNVGGTAGNRSTLCITTSFTLGDTPYEAGAAQYDSGGPVFIDNGGEWDLAGVNLYISGPIGGPYTGNAMAKVAYYRDWITNNIPNYDSDMDGLPDWWETKYGGDSTSMVASADSDSDSFSNYQEWIADTDPTDGNSYPQVSIHTNEIAFNSSTNREYQIDYRTDLSNTNQTWLVEPGMDWFAPAGTQTVKTVTAPISNRFYRVEARLP